MVTRLRSLPPVTWVRAVPLALVAYVLIAVPSDLIDTPVFGRPIEVRAIDYLIAAVAAALIGLTLAVRPEASSPDETAGIERDETRTVWGGFVSFLAVGCPVCNQAVVGLLGTGGALTWWSPVQPFVGLVAIGLLAFTLRRRLASHQLESCPVPT